jgi:outer membrane protein assembly factor BamB
MVSAGGFASPRSGGNDHGSFRSQFRVAFVGAGNTAYALNTSTGAVLWTYQDSNSGSDFWGAPAISNGHAYFGNQDGTLYAFGT